MNETESVESKKLLRVGIYERLSDEDMTKLIKKMIVNLLRIKDIFL